jgi:hypothetical protein
VSEPAKTGTIYDIGYKRYVGTRRPPSTRWRVIMRHQLSTAWKKWWRYKLALGMAVIAMFVAGGFMFAGYEGNRAFRGFGSASEVTLRFLDGAMPLAIEWLCRGAFVLSLTLGATIIANDTRSNAFTFYFVRSIRPIDYVAGKLAGYAFLVATIIVAPVLLLTAMRLGLSEDFDQFVATLHIVPKALAVTLLATAVFTTIPLAMSALIANPRYALALWAAYYMIIASIATQIAKRSTPELAIFDPITAIRVITYDLFDIRLLRNRLPPIPTTTAVVGLIAQAGAAIALIWYQVSRDQKTGVGGSS